MHRGKQSERSWHRVTRASDHRERAMIERMILLGASGDLTGRLLMPAIAQLAEADRLPPHFAIVGAANTEWSTDDFREHIAAKLAQHASVGAPARDAVVRALEFQPCDVTEPAALSALIGQERSETLVYLALAPDLFAPALRTLAATGLRTTDAVAVEKPFGTDLASAQELNEIVRLGLPKPTIFRIDHFLSSDWCVAFSASASSTAFTSRSGMPTTSSASTSAGWRVSPWRGALATTTAQGRSRTWCRTTCWRRWRSS